QVVLLGFSAILVIGAELLHLPVSRATDHPLVDDLFMAASAVFTTGLSLTDVSSMYTPWGQGFLIGLIQLGGLGYMTIFTLSLLLVRQRLSLRDRLHLQEVLEQPGLHGLAAFVLSIVRFTATVEFLGVLLLSIRTIPRYGLGKGLFVALFHTVAAFNNAGFPLYPEGLLPWRQDPLFLLVLAGLIIVSGLGFAVNRELVSRYVLGRPPKARWNLLIGVVLGMTAFLLLVTTLLYWVAEAPNPRTLGALGPPWQALNAFFMAVQPRSTGFATIEVGAMTQVSLLWTVVLMFVGAGPGGTASGVKLTTMAVVGAAIWATLRGQEEVEFYHLKRRIDPDTVRKAFAVVFLSGAWVVLVTALMILVEPFPFFAVLFEVFSAFGNAGLSMGITGHLSDAGKLLLTATMLVGRVGILTLLLAWLPPRRPSAVRYAEETLLVS
ncbi:MAG TPA: potassium transporter TrkG, partial [Stenomitos sp.]